MEQDWFEISDVRQRTFARAVWIPLRAIHQIEETAEFGRLGNRAHFFGAGSVAAHHDRREEAARLGWMDVGISRSHSGYCDGEIYSPACLFEEYAGETIGENLVLEQSGNGLWWD